MTPSQFVSTYLPYARRVQSDIGLNAWAVLTQWALETGWGSSFQATTYRNLAGIKHFPPGVVDGVFAEYASLDAFVADYEATLRNGYYPNVLATAGQGVETVLTEFGKSPWDATHYGDPPGSHLIALWRSSLAPLAGSAGAAADPTGTFRDLFVSIAGLASALGQPPSVPPWASAQGLTPGHLGTVPDLASGANWLAGWLYALAVAAKTHARGGVASAVTAVPSGVPSGSTDAGTIGGPIYVGLVDMANALGTGLVGVPWADAQNLPALHWGHPPDLGTGLAWLTAQVSAMATTYRTGQLVFPGPPVPAPAPVGQGGIAPPLPVIPPTPGPGLAGLAASWEQLRTLLTSTLPDLANRVDGDVTAATGGTPSLPASHNT